MQKVRLEDVAAKAGISKTAASFALNGAWVGKLSKETVSRALAAAEELGYRPNYTAKSLRTQTTSTIGFISTEVSVTRWAMDMISGALLAATNHDHALLIGETSPSGVESTSNSGLKSTRGKKELAALLDRQIDGLIIAELVAKQIDAPDLNSGIPVIYLNCKGPSGSISILPDEYQGGCALVNELFASYRPESVLLVGVDSELERDLRKSATIGDRLRGIRDTLESHGVATFEIPGRFWSASFGYESFLKAQPQYKPDAVIALNDQIGFGIYQASQDLGLKVGKDFSLVSFDDDELSRLVRPGLTTAQLPYREMGKLAVELLLSGDATPGVHKVPMPIQQRGSVIANQ